MHLFENVGMVRTIIYLMLVFIPTLIAVMHLVWGARLFIRGKKASNKAISISGYNRIFYALLALGFILLPWRWLCEGFLL
jgi:hypothetical protein